LECLIAKIDQQDTFETVLKTLCHRRIVLKSLGGVALELLPFEPSGKPGLKKVSFVERLDYDPFSNGKELFPLATSSRSSGKMSLKPLKRAELYPKPCGTRAASTWKFAMKWAF
jgi:hypothetical protein